MFQSKFNRLIVAGLATAAVVPTAAVARVAGEAATAPQTQDLRAPDQVGGAIVAAPGTGVVQDLRTPDRVDGTQVGKVVAPVTPQPVKTAAPNTTSDDGIDDGVLIALGGGAVLLVAGIGVAGRKRLQVVRQRQLA
jgi:hypothetical protein